MQLVLAVAEMTDQRKLTIAKIGNQLSQPVGAKQAIETLRIDGAEQRRVAKELPFTGRAGAIKLLGERIESFPSGRILPVDVGQSFTKCRAELQQPGRMFFDQFIPSFTAQSPERGFLYRIDGRRTGLAGTQ